MTCASCAARVAKKLNALEGVEANVNFATETAAVRFDDSRLAADELIRAVEAAGYAASVGAAVHEPVSTAGFVSRSQPC